MNAASFWDALIWTRFGNPRHERPLYQRVLREKPLRLVELGIRGVERSTRLIRLAQRARAETILYCGIDLFEAREENPLPLKTVHNHLVKTGAKVRLVPGDLMSAVARSANLLLETDFLLVDSSISTAELRSVYPFLPRMLHADSSIAHITGGQVRWMKPTTFLAAPSKAA